MLSRLTNKWQEFYDVANTESLQRVLKSMVQRDIVDARPNIDASADVRLKPTSKAPDEALIEKIAEETFKRWCDREFNQAEATKWAIHEYIRRSAGKEKG